jgi:NhaP-type Na+/H+ or K+/H+ antiporter
VTTLLVFAAILLLYGIVSRPLDKRGVTSALVFTVVGLAVGTAGLELIEVELESTVAETLTEIALALLLFSDAARLDPIELRRHRAWPSRLLLVGLPLTLVLGTGAGLLVFPGMALASAFLLSTMLASTDAALGQRVVTDEAVPERVRQALDVESGLNDGLAVPFFLVAVDLARAELTTGFTWAVVWNAAEQIGWGLVAGIGAGALGGLLFRLAARRGWLEGMWRQIVPLAVALLAFTAAVEFGGSGFIAAFVGGMAYGYVSRERQLSAMYFTEQAGDLLAALVWIGFGAAALAWAAPHVTWQIVVYALLSLTVVRMLPVAIAFWRTGAKPQTVAFIGWFGPRGLASIVFALLALEEGVPDSTTLLTTVVVTVALSVLAHGLTSAPLVGVYQRWYTSRADEHPSSAEAAPAALPRARRPLAASGSHVLRRADD